MPGQRLAPLFAARKKERCIFKSGEPTGKRLEHEMHSGLKTEVIERDSVSVVVKMV